MKFSGGRLRGWEETKQGDLWDWRDMCFLYMVATGWLIANIYSPQEMVCRGQGNAEGFCGPLCSGAVSYALRGLEKRDNSDIQGYVAKREQISLLKVKIDHCPESHKPRMSLPAMTCF